MEVVKDGMSARIARLKKDTFGIGANLQLHSSFGTVSYVCLYAVLHRRVSSRTAQYIMFN